jgi:hypothetical protein
MGKPYSNMNEISEKIFGNCRLSKTSKLVLPTLRFFTIEIFRYFAFV